MVDYAPIAKNNEWFSAKTHIFVGYMNKAVHILISGLIVLLALVCAVEAEEPDSMAKLSMEPAETPVVEPKVTSVYGISADDYLLPSIDAKKQLRPNVRSASSHPSFDLPDAFYFIGGPIFLLLFLRVLVIFLNGFEEKRREEQRQAGAEAPSSAE
jgi:hypothetical protein